MRIHKVEIRDEGDSDWKPRYMGKGMGCPAVTQTPSRPVDQVLVLVYKATNRTETEITILDRLAGRRNVRDLRLRIRV